MCGCKYYYVGLYILQSIYISITQGISSVLFYVDVCLVFGWDRVNFLTNSWYSSAFWIYYRILVDSTLMFWLLSNASLSQGLFGVSCSAREELQKELGGMARAGDLNWSKGYSMA